MITGNDESGDRGTFLTCIFLGVDSHGSNIQQVSRDSGLLNSPFAVP
jgi:hypothetical protein